MSSEEEQIKKLMQYATSANDNVKAEVIDALAEYGEKGIEPIYNIIDKTNNDALKIRGLQALKSIKEKGRAS
jgi:hypothetical protein